MLDQETFLGGANIRSVALATATAIGVLLGATAPASAYSIDFEGFGPAASGCTGISSCDPMKDNGLRGETLYSGGVGASGVSVNFFGYVPNDDNNPGSPVSNAPLDVNNPGGDWNTARPLVLFDSNNPTGGDGDLAAPFTNNGNLGPSTPGHFLIIHERANECNTAVCNDPDDEGTRPAGKMFIDFSQEIVLESIDFFDIEGAENGNTINNQIVLYDSAGAVIPNLMFYTPNTGGNNKWDQVDFGNLSGVKTVEVRLGGSGAIDNIKFGVTQVTEPAGLGLLAFGMIAMGTIRRRRSRGLRPSK